MNHPVQPNHRDQDIRALCTHLIPPAPSGPAHLCGSPALLGQAFCYYHHPARRADTNRDAYRTRCRDRRIARQSFNLPLPTSRRELQHSLNKIISLIATNQIDLRRASLLIHALQVASKNLRE